MRPCFRLDLAGRYALKIQADRGDQCKACTCNYPRTTITVFEGAHGGGGDAIVRTAGHRNKNTDFVPD
jgi:hypothetical protein